MFDVHFHWYPAEMIGYVRSHMAKLPPLLNEPFEDVEKSLRMMDGAGTERSLISYAFLEPFFSTFPGTPAECCRAFVSAAAEMTARYPGRFLHSAVVDVMAGEEAVPDLESAVREYGCSALQIMTCYPKGDDTIFPHEKLFWPLYAKAEQLGIPVFVHPVRPHFWSKLPSTVQFTGADWGFMLGDQLAVHLMACAGVFDAFPKLQFIFCQLGGFVPFTLGRVDLGLAMEEVHPIRNPGVPGMKLVRLRDYAGRFYVDIHSCDSLAIRCAVEAYGADRLLFATDYPITPLTIGPTWHRREVQEAGFSSEATSAILSGNANRLFSLS